MKNQRIYTVFLLPDGDEIPLSFRSEKEIKKFQKQFPSYKKTYSSYDDPKVIKNIINSVFTYKSTLKKSGLCKWV